MRPLKHRLNQEQVIRVYNYARKNLHALAGMNSWDARAAVVAQAVGFLVTGQNLRQIAHDGGLKGLAFANTRAGAVARKGQDDSVRKLAVVLRALRHELGLPNHPDVDRLAGGAIG